VRERVARVKYCDVRHTRARGVCVGVGVGVGVEVCVCGYGCVRMGVDERDSTVFHVHMCV